MNHTQPIQIKAANRTQQVQEYYFSKKLQQIDQLRRSGVNILNLGIGSPDLPPSDETINTLYENAKSPKNHGYQSYIGIPALREAFSKWYVTYFNVNLDPATEILPLIGSKEGIMHITMAFVNEGEEVLIPDPGYPAYEAVTRIVGGKVRKYNLTEESGWYPDLQQLEKEGLENVKMMWVNYPHMPTGTKATTEIYASLVAFARKHRILLCNDNPYSFILNDETLSILSIPGAKEVTLELNSLSKSHNMAGWRIGMVAGKAEFIKTILLIKSNMDSGMFQPLQAAAVHALQADMAWYTSVNKTYKARRQYAEQIMDAMGCSFNPKQSGMFLWGRIPEKYKDAEELTEKVLHEAQVFITPGFIFGTNGERFVRISLCSTEQALQEAADRIKNMLNNK